MTDTTVTTEMKPIAVLRREIGESTWFDWYPIRPGCRTHIDLQKGGGMDYCEVYPRPALTDEQANLLLLDVGNAIGLLNSMVRSGEQHTETSEAVVDCARAALSAIREAIGRGEK